jgi:hypothetical protein
MLTRITLAMSVLLTVACDPGYDGGDDDSFRKKKPYPGDGDLSIYQGTNTDSPDDLIWDLKNGFVFQGAASSTNLLLNNHDGQILDASNTTLYCEMVGAHQLVDVETGEILFTQRGKKVFAGDIYDDRPELEDWEDDADADIEEGHGPPLFRFKKDHVFEGRRAPDEEPLVTATEKIAKSNPFRKLVIAALIAGECGSLGLPER